MGQRPSLVEKHHQYHQSFPSVVLTSSASKSSSSLFVTQNIQKSPRKIFYLLGEPYLFIALPKVKQNWPLWPFFLLFPPSLKQQIFSVFGDNSSDLKKKRKQHFFDLKSIFFCLYVFFIFKNM